MSPRDFKIWQASVGLNGKKTAEALGKSEDTISLYRSKGVPMPDATLRLAMSAVEKGLAPWAP